MPIPWPKDRAAVPEAPDSSALTCLTHGGSEPTVLCLYFFSASETASVNPKHMSLEDLIILRKVKDGKLDPDLKCIEGAENIMECIDGVKNRKLPRSRSAGRRHRHAWRTSPFHDAAGSREPLPKVQSKSRPACKPESLPILDHQDSQDERHTQVHQYLQDAPARKRQRQRQQVDNASETMNPINSQARGWHLGAVLSQGPHDSNTMQATLKFWSTELCTHDMVKFLPHMKARHPLHTLLVLRATCRQMIPPCISAMAHRINFLLRLSRHRRIMLSVQQTSQLSRIIDSGFLFQSWLPSLPGTDKWRHELKRQGLLSDRLIPYRPLGMTHEYWVKLQERCVQCSIVDYGWIDDKLIL